CLSPIDAEPSIAKSMSSLPDFVSDGGPVSTATSGTLASSNSVDESAPLHAGNKHTPTATPKKSFRIQLEYNQSSCRDQIPKRLIQRCICWRALPMSRAIWLTFRFVSAR